MRVFTSIDKTELISFPNFTTIYIHTVWRIFNTYNNIHGFSTIYLADFLRYIGAFSHIITRISNNY